MMKEELDKSRAEATQASRENQFTKEMLEQEKRASLAKSGEGDSAASMANDVEVVQSFMDVVRPL